MSIRTPEISEAREQELAGLVDRLFVGASGLMMPTEVRDMLRVAYLYGKSDGLKESREFFERLWSKEAP